jgi:hypothetical protein
MALGINLAPLRNNMLDTITTRAGSLAVIRVFSGARPATGGAETTLLSQLTCNATFAPAASSAVLTLNAITADASADASGTASWFRLQSSGGNHVFDGNVGTSGSDLNFNTVSFIVGGNVAITSFTITAPNP